MSEVRSDFLNEMKKVLKRSNLDIFSILFMLDILGYCFLNPKKSVFNKNYFIQVVLRILEQAFSKETILIIACVYLVMILAIVVIVKTGIKLPKKTFVNGKVVGYSCTTALKHMVYLLYYYAYSLNILYISMLLWFNQRNDLTLSNVEYILIIVDIVILICKLIRSIFQYSDKSEFRDVIDNEFFDISYFVLDNKKIDYYTNIMILKDKIMRNHAFYVVKQETTYKKNGFPNNPIYTILDSSLNFEDIKYSYEYYSKTEKTTPSQK